MRVWQVQFHIADTMKNFPIPGELIEELQDNPAYYIHESQRSHHTGGQFSITLEGEGRFHDGEKEFCLNPGTGFLALHGRKNVSYYYPVDGKTPWRTLWISFYGKVAENMMQEIISKHGHIFELPIDKGIIRRLSAYRNYNNTVQALTCGAGAKMVMDVFVSLTEKDEKTQLNDPHHELLRQIKQYMLENISRDYGVADIADFLNVSREHLSRFFSGKTGESLAWYIRRNKIRRACHILRETRLSCGDVGKQVGYFNPASFGRVFKKITGMTPENFRIAGYIPKL